MNTEKFGLAIVAAFSGWCLYRGLTSGESGAWALYMTPATIAVLLGGVLAFNLGRRSDADHRD